MRKIKPGLPVEIVDLSEKPDAGRGLIFAVPTCVYEARPVFAGNPSPIVLRGWLDSLDPGL